MITNHNPRYDRKPIYVTKTFLPPIDEYHRYLVEIWRSGVLTNQGPTLLELESKLGAYLGIKSDIHLVGNGTIALQLALSALGIIDGEVITTPFSYVATTSAILWEKLTPVFVDIDPQSLCMDANKIEAAITRKTKAIMPVHVFGYPCNVEEINAIAKKHDLKVVYDAAHAFGVKYKGRSLLDFGDISTCSFHATKLFHTVEGGAAIVKNKQVSETLELVKRFGHDNDDHQVLGINGKSSEFNAAMGLCNLKYIDGVMNNRKVITELYDAKLTSIIERPKIPENTTYNYSYYPVLMANESQLLDVMYRMAEINVYPRRYFYPSLNTLPYLAATQTCPISEDIARRILCLPLYHDLPLETVSEISEVLIA